MDEWLWMCNWCGEDVTNEEASKSFCPKCECTWCGDDCCGAMALCYKKDEPKPDTAF